MKRNTLDRQIIKALTIGISATMAMQPLTVFANEAEGTALPEVPEETDTYIAAKIKVLDWKLVKQDVNLGE